MRFTPASVNQSTPGVPAFNSGTGGADTLIVKKSVSLVALYHGAALAAPGAWTVSVNGLIKSTGANGIDLAAGIVGLSKITIGGTGEVTGANGIVANSRVSITNFHFINATAGNAVTFNALGTNKLINAGTIGGGIIGGAGDETVTNSKTITSFIDLGDGTNTIVNKGTIQGGIYGGLDKDVFINSGKLLTFVDLDDGSNTFINKGTISQGVYGGLDKDVFTNSGRVLQFVDLDDGNNTFINKGTITQGVYGGLDKDVFTNSGRLLQFVDLDDGNNTFINKGTITQGVYGGLDKDVLINSGVLKQFVDLDDGSNSIVNFGRIEDNVYGGDDKDTITNFKKIGHTIISGTILGTIDLGGGDDTFKGGSKSEHVRGGIGIDTVKLGAGNDSYLASGNNSSDGNDKVDGGRGVDFYDATAASASLLINLDSKPHDISPIASAGLTSANTCADILDQTKKDVVLHFENARGGSAGDAIYGTAAANKLDGAGGDDDLFGYGGNDTLIGGNAGDTILAGGKGRDVLWGGQESGSGDSASDNFFFFSIQDSGASIKTRDVIMDFEDGFDHIHLGIIDANKTNGPATNDDFSFIAGNFTGAGQLRVQSVTDGWIIQGNVDGDKQADFSIKVVDSDHSVVWTAADFFGVV